MKVGQVEFSLAGIDAAVDAAVSAAAEGRGVSLRFSNAYCVGLAGEDEDYRLALESPGCNFADGLPVAWILRKASGSQDKLDAFRVRGPSFFERTIEAGCNRNIRHSFIGATDDTLDRLAEWIKLTYPMARVAGVYSPPFSPVNESFLRSIESAISEQQPQLVWLGLGTPKQDLAAMHLAKTFPNIVFASVGAAFDFKAGVALEAPVWVQKSGFEWLFRFLTEPRRLWRRYSVGTVNFLREVSQQWVVEKLQKIGVRGHQA